MKEDKLMLLETALACPQCVVSVMGAHAGEESDAIFKRKTADILRVGKTFWLMRSPKARPSQVQSICDTITAYAIFIEPATEGGARPTTADAAAKEYSDDKKFWQPFPNGLSPVTGKLDTNATALVFDMITTTVSGTFDLWDYADLTDIRKPLKFILGCSTICALRKDMTSHSEKMKSRFRRIVAVARLAKPYCVWLQ